MEISLFASAIRPHLWVQFMDSLKGNTIDYEVIFAGFIDESLVQEITDKYTNFKYITTKDIKPAQCYEIARRACTGEVVGWVSDDCVFKEGDLDKIYNKVMELPYRSILQIGIIDPKCNAEENFINNHRFFPRNVNTPRVAQVGFMQKEYLDSLGGFDRRYVFGKFEADLSMRVWADGGEVVPFSEVSIQIDHTNKNGCFNNDWSGVNEDSEIIENSWCVDGYNEFEKGIPILKDNSIQWYFPITNREVTIERKDKFEPYEEPISLTKSQSTNTRWE